MTICPTAPAPLAGDELLAKVNELKGAPKSELVRACGFIGTRKYKNEAGEVEERESLMFAEFSDALLKANGLDLTPDRPSAAGDGTRASYRATVQKASPLVVGKPYILEGEFVPGTEFAIQVGLNAIMLVMVDPETGEPQEPEFPADEDA